MANPVYSRLAALLLIASMIAAPLLSLLPLPHSPQGAPGVVASAETQQPFQLLKVFYNVENKQLEAAWAAVAFLREEGGGYTPYLMITSHTQSTNAPSQTVIYNMDTWEEVVSTTQSGAALLQVSENAVLLPSFIGKLYVLDIQNFRLYISTDSDWFSVEEDIGGFKLHLARSVTWIEIKYVLYDYTGEPVSYSFTVHRDDIINYCGFDSEIVATSSAYYFSYPGISDGSIAVESLLAKDRSTGEFVAVFAAVDLNDGSVVDVECYDFGSNGENIRALVEFYTRSSSRVSAMRADGLWPYIAGTDGTDEFYVVKFAGGEIQLNIVNTGALLPDPSSAAVRLARDSGGDIHIVAYFVDSDGTPVVRFIDPETLSVEKTIELSGYNFDYPVMDVGLYYGQPAVYVGVKGHVVVVSVDEMDVVYALPTASGDVVKAIDFNRGTAGQTLMVRVFNTTTNKHNIEVYAHVTAVRGTRITLQLAGDTATVGGGVQATAVLTTLAGEPLAGRTIHIEELVEGEWVVVASGVTGSDGSVTVTIPVNERGVHYYRAVYAGGGSDAPCVSSVRMVKAYREASVAVNAPSVWPSTLPASVEVVVSDANTGEALKGYWVTLYANFTWGDGPVGSAKTDYSGKAVVTVKLPPGNYRLWATVDDAYVMVEESQADSMRVFEPGQPPPEGPYVAPVGRVVSLGTAVAEPGKPAVVVFAFYYGDQLRAPDSYTVTVTPDAPYSVEEAEAGVFKVTVTPPGTGVYTVVFKAVYYGSSYIGAASMLSVNVSARVDEWGASIASTLSDLEELRAIIEEYLSDINETLASANMTEVYELVKDNHNILLQVNGRLALALSLTQAIDAKASWLLGNLSEVKTVTLSNGETLAVIMGSVSDIADVLEAVNATLASVSGSVAVIKSNVGTILARTGDILESVQAIGSDVFHVKTMLGEIQVNLTGLAAKIDRGISAVASEIQKLNGTIAAVLLEVKDGKATLLTIRDGQAQIQSILLDELKPQVAAIGDKLALLNTTIGLVAAKADAAAQAASQAAQKAGAASTKLDELSSKLDQLAQEIQSLKQTVEEQAQAKPAGDTTARALGGAGLAAGLAALAAALIRRH